MEIRQPFEAVTNIEFLNLWNQMIRTIRLVAPLVAGFLSLGPTTLAAQEALTLDRAVQEALARNRLLGAELARVKAAREARSRAAAEADDVRTAVHLEVVTALRRLEAADARQTAGRAAVDQARESHRIVRDRFEAGLAGVTDVLRASSALMDAEAQRIAAIVDSTTTEAMLRRAVGRRP